MERSEDRCLVNSQWGAFVGAAVPQFIGPTQAEVHFGTDLASTAFRTNSSLHSRVSSDSLSSYSLSSSAVTQPWESFASTSSDSIAATTVSTYPTGSEPPNDSHLIPQFVNPVLPSGLASDLTATLFGNALFDVFDHSATFTGTNDESAVRPIARPTTEYSFTSHDSATGTVYSSAPAAGVAGPVASVAIGNLAITFPSTTGGFGEVSVAPRSAASESPPTEPTAADACTDSTEETEGGGESQPPTVTTAGGAEFVETSFTIKEQAVAGELPGTIHALGVVSAITEFTVKVTGNNTKANCNGTFTVTLDVHQHVKVSYSITVTQLVGPNDASPLSTAVRDALSVVNGFTYRHEEEHVTNKKVAFSDGDLTASATATTAQKAYDAAIEKMGTAFVLRKQIMTATAQILDDQLDLRDGDIGLQYKAWYESAKKASDAGEPIPPFTLSNP